MPFLLLLLATLLSCSHVKKIKTSGDSKGYFEQAQEYKKKGQFAQALEQLQELKKKFLYDSYNKEATLLTADIYFEQEQFAKAQEHYKNFQKIYPQTRSFYVLYQLGRTFFERLPSSVDRDLSFGAEALKHFKPLLKAKNPYREQARKYIQQIQLKQAQKEWEQIRFYLKKNWNESALKKLKSFIASSPQSPLLPQALLLAYNLAKKMKKQAHSFKARLLKEFPQSQEAQSL